MTWHWTELELAILGHMHVAAAATPTAAEIQQCFRWEPLRKVHDQDEHGSD